MLLPETIFQPDSYRDRTGLPAWAFFPHLGAMLGWNVDVWEALTREPDYCQVNAVRQIAFFPGGGETGEEAVRRAEQLHDWQCGQDRYSLRPQPMFLALEADGSVTRLIGQDFWRVHHEPAGPLPMGRDLFLDGDEDYRFVVGGTEHDRHVVMQHRTKRLSPAFRAKREELGLPVDVVRGQGKKRCLAGDAEKAFAAWASTLKSKYVAWREPHLRDSPESRPVRWRFVEHRLLRERWGEIERGRNGPGGQKKAPYFPEELESKTSHNLARLESIELGFEYIWSDILRLTSDGYVTTA